MLFRSVEYTYNNTVHTSKGMAPFEIVEGGRKVPPILQTKERIFEVDTYVEDLKTAYEKVKHALQRSQDKRKRTTDKKRRELILKKDDWVLLRFHKARLRTKKGKIRLYTRTEYAVLWTLSNTREDQ